jgi:dolichyl-phosphate beta-glucosyltransferase
VTIDLETEIIVVDDGSDDGTADAALQAEADQVLELKENRGKGAAVRAGVSVASGSYVLFTDVDLAYEPSQILKLIEALNAGADVVLGSRRHSASQEVNSPGVVREWGSRVFNRLTRIVVPSPHLDTQCGLKGFTSEAAQTIFSRAKVDGFAFDVEVLFLARNLGCVITEIPVTLDHVEQSTVKFIPQAIRMLWDVIRVRVWSNLGRYGDLPPRHG